ncbi:MAG: DUF480 domain-containing protein [Pirellulaceae bacterium]|nr:DUF480 domain-containing protein [Pirellulaceae bacterium]
MNSVDSEPQATQRKWQPLTSIQRRVLGVLVEKAKTTPDAYPMTLNALTTGCNQKSNRSPLMAASPEEVESALEELRGMGAVAEIQGGGRANKYRHFAYDWLGVDKVEAAVMTELLLRGEQTLGDLRGRAARMEPIADINALRPVIESLIAKGLVIALTPAGRGQVVTHALYKQRDLDALRQHYANYVEPSSAAAPGPASSAGSATSSGSGGSGGRSARSESDELRQLRDDVAALKDEMAELREQMRQLLH